MRLAQQNRKPMSEETREKLRLINTGKVMSEESKRKMSLSSIGKIPSEETRKKISVANMGNTSKNNTTLSEDTKTKMRAAWVIRKAKQQA